MIYALFKARPVGLMRGLQFMGFSHLTGELLADFQPGFIPFIEQSG